MPLVFVSIAGPTGCGEDTDTSGFACPQIAIPAITVDVRNAITYEPVNCLASVQIDSSDYDETATLPLYGQLPALLSAMGSLTWW